MFGDPAIACLLDGLRIKMVPAHPAFPPHMDNFSLGQDINMFENARATDIRKQRHQLARLLGASGQRLNNQTPPPVAERLPDQVFMNILICHYMVTYLDGALLSTYPDDRPKPPVLRVTCVNFGGIL